MIEAQRIVAATVATAAMLFASMVSARDAVRSPVPPGQTPPIAIPNPYAPAAKTAPATDAYATGFAIGLGSALIAKQLEDERLRQNSQEPAPGQRR